MSVTRQTYGRAKRTYAQQVALFALLAAVVMILAACGSRSTGELPKLGEPMADFTATDSDGNRFRLSEAYQEGPVVLVFYRGYFCGICQQQLRDLEANRVAIEGLGAQIVVMSTDDQGLARRTKEELGLNFTVLIDPKQEILRQFDHKERYSTLDVFNPAVYIVDESGVVVYERFGKHANDRPTPTEIIQRLQAI